jgi:hypothetical protein
MVMNGFQNAEGDAHEWFSECVDNTFKTLKDLLDVFTEKWGDKKEHRHLLASLNYHKKE